MNSLTDNPFHAMVFSRDEEANEEDHEPPRTDIAMPAPSSTRKTANTIERSTRRTLGLQDRSQGSEALPRHEHAATTFRHQDPYTTQSLGIYATQGMAPLSGNDGSTALRGGLSHRGTAPAKVTGSSHLTSRSSFKSMSETKGGNEYTEKKTGVEAYETQIGAFPVTGPGTGNEIDEEPVVVSTASPGREQGFPRISTEAEVVDRDEDVRVIREEMLRNTPVAEAVISNNRCRLRKGLFLGASLLLVALASLAISLGVVLSHRGKTKTPTPPSLQQLIALLSPISSDGGAALQTPGAPQNMALNWLAKNNTNLGLYSDEKITQRYVLATVYFSTGGANWNDNNLWLDDNDECGRWWQFGNDTVTCRTATGALENLDLSINNLMGSIPPEIGLLPESIDWIDLSENKLNCPIPTDIARLKSLTWLDLSHNYFNGTIPSGAFYNMTNLDELWLHNNNFTGSFTCPEFIEYCYISCDPKIWNNETCRSL